jgi:hypothetical protein
MSLYAFGQILGLTATDPGREREQSALGEQPGNVLGHLGPLGYLVENANSAIAVTPFSITADATEA